MRIYLTGFMASGKSTVGPRVAERMGLDFVDLDDLIEDRADQSIPEIFAAEGEERFRTIEAEALRTTVEHDDVVIALGGGALVDTENLAVAKQHGLVVYLRVSPDELMRRLKDEADARPLLQDEDGTPLEPAAIRTKIEGMLNHRRPFYERSHITVDAARPVQEVVASVVRRVNERASG